MKKRNGDYAAPPCASPGTYLSKHFDVTYCLADPGMDEFGRQTILEPGGTAFLRVVEGGQQGTNRVPTYVRRLAYWLDRAYDAFLAPPFSMPDPAASRVSCGELPTGNVRIPVLVSGLVRDSDASYCNCIEAAPTPLSLDFAGDYPPDLLADAAAHEVFHLFQATYGGYVCEFDLPALVWRRKDSSAWTRSLYEGGAVFASGLLLPRLGRYLAEAGVLRPCTGVRNDGTPLTAGESSVVSSSAEYIQGPGLRVVS